MKGCKTCDELRKDWYASGEYRFDHLLLHQIAKHTSWVAEVLGLLEIDGVPMWTMYQTLEEKRQELARELGM